ncbi:MAG TPA: ATP-binding protein [Nannocystaceae bacterium]|nr:ATP-binding protein [Nannocystaceae bacterium]
MNGDDLALEISRMHARADALREDALDLDEAPPVLHRALAELLSSVEELRVVEEELREQNAELLRANAALERERRRYTDLFEHAPVPYAVTDDRGVLRLVNQAAGTLLQQPVAVLVGKPMALLVTKEDRERWRALLERVLAGEPDADTLRLEVDGLSLRVRLEGIAQPEEPTGAGCRWILEDVEARERATLADRLAADARRKDEFLAVLGHELRNPLAPIHAAVELWRNHAAALTDEQRQWTVDVVSRQSEHLAHLVDDLLDASRAAHGKIRLQRTEVDLRDIVEQSREVVRARAQLHRFEVLLPAVPVVVDADPMRLRQVVVNLLDNAIKFAPRGGHLVAQVRSEGGRGFVVVRDDGIGIAAEMRERVFGLFTQSEQSLARAAGGLGLGLPLVRRLTELHGGSVTVRSDGLGHGSEFEVALPLAVRSSPTRAGTPKPAATIQRLRLLVVDDNVDGAQMLATLLEASGHEVTMAFDGAGALEVFEQLRPDAVLLDLGLPDLDGLAVAAHMKAVASRVHLIAVTGYGDERVRAQARDAGFVDHLLKPVELEALRRALEKVPRRSG